MCPSFTRRNYPPARLYAPLWDNHAPPAPERRQNRRLGSLQADNLRGCTSFATIFITSSMRFSFRRRSLYMQANTQARRQGGRLEYKWIVAMVTIIAVFMSILDQTIVNIAVPRLQSAFGADLHSVQWVLTAYILTLGIITPTAAFFSERFGIKRFYMASLAAFTVGSALCGLAWNLPVLIFFRILQGIGGAALFPLSITLLFREFPPQERGTAMGTFGIPALIAPALGPTLGGYLVTYAGWQAIFYINVPVGIMGVILAGLFLREAPIEANTRFDVIGFIFAAIG